VAIVASGFPGSVSLTPGSLVSVPGIQHALTAIVSGLCKRHFRGLWERGCFNIFKTFKILFVGGIFFGEKVGGADLLMVGFAVMFGEVIGLIETAFAPINYKLALASTVANPIKAHVNGFGWISFA
jgi:hypothetical protein